MGRITLHGSVASAVGGAVAGSYGAMAVALDGGRMRMAMMTPFGPVVRSWPGVSNAFVARFLGETLASKERVVHLSLSDPDARGDLESLGLTIDDAEEGIGGDAPHGDPFQAFEAERPPVIGRADADGVERVMWWSIAPYPESDALRVGDRLRLTEEAGDGRTVLRYRGPCGEDGGIHAILGRPIDPRESAIVASVAARVTSFVHGASGQGAQRCTTKLLVLSIPVALAREFADGKVALGRGSAPHALQEMVDA